MRIFWRLWRLYAVSPWHLTLAIGCTVLTVGFSLTVPWILKEVLDEGLVQGRLYIVYLASGLLVAVTALRSIAAYGQSYVSASLAQHLAYRLRQQVYNQIQQLSFAYHDHVQTGELMSRATSDIEAVRWFFHFGMPAGISLVLTGAGTIVALATFDWHLACLALGMVPFFVAVIIGIGRVLRPLQVLVQERTAALSVTLQESLAGIRVVKAFVGEQRQTTTFMDTAEHLYQAYLKVVAKEAFNLPLLTLLLSLALALTLWFGGRQVVAGTMSLGTLVAATGYLAQLALPLRRLSWLTGLTSMCQAGAERLFEVLDMTPTVQETALARPLPVLQGNVCFDHVSFYYDRQIPVLHDVTFTAQPGQVIALLGSTGSGKSTMAQLIPRFYDVTGGRITIDGTDIREVQLTALRQQIGIVLQETFLFSTTIRDNIAFGCEDLPLDTIIAAAQAARAHDFIMAFPDGYDTWVGERGVTLSGGQRQRVAIARAFVRQPRLLILDDATSSVDMETEYLIQQALQALMVGRTTFVIAQRLRTLKHADMILVLEDGRVVQQGTHVTLVVQPGLYRRIYDLQLRDQEEFLQTVTTETASLDSTARLTDGMQREY